MMKFSLKDLLLVVTYICFCLGSYKIALNICNPQNEKYDIHKLLKVTSTKENNTILKRALDLRDHKFGSLVFSFIFNFLIILVAMHRVDSPFITIYNMINLFALWYFVFMEVLR